jgi:hypothetical protein
MSNSLKGYVFNLLRLGILTDQTMLVIAKNQKEAELKIVAELDERYKEGIMDYSLNDEIEYDDVII